MRRSDNPPRLLFQRVNREKPHVGKRPCGLIENSSLGSPVASGGHSYREKHEAVQRGLSRDHVGMGEPEG